MLNLMKKRTEKGFTLIELMIVVAIIGILAAIAIPQFSSYRIKAFNSSAQADLKNFMTAEEAAYADTQGYLPVTGVSTGTPARLATSATVTGTDPMSAVGNSKGVGYAIITANSNANYAAYTGHSQGDRQFAGDDSGYIGFRSVAVAAAATGAAGETAAVVNSTTYGAL